MRKGLFIVLEGVDGAGTTTQVEQLSAALRTRVPVHATREPSAGPVGMLLRLALTGRLVTQGALGPRAPGWQTMALMFAADRLDHVESEIRPLLDEGVCVVTDRYYHSSIAYQACTSGTDPVAIEWIRAINRYAPQPDLTIVLDVAAELAAQRRRQRAARELFEEEMLQAKLVDFYAQLERYFPNERLVHLAGDGSIEQVAAAVLGQVEPLLRAR